MRAALCSARPVRAARVPRLPASCLSGLSGVFPLSLPTACFSLCLQLWDPELPPTQVSLLEAPRSPAQPLSWPPPMALLLPTQTLPSRSPMGPWAWRRAGGHISGQGRLPGKHPGLFSSPPPPTLLTTKSPRVVLPSHVHLPPTQPRVQRRETSHVLS